jgi:hypothetical protein
MNNLSNEQQNKLNITVKDILKSFFNTVYKNITPKNKTDPGNSDIDFEILYKKWIEDHHITKE